MNNNPAHLQPSVSEQQSQADLSPLEKLARSREALQQALFPPPKKKSSAISTLRKLWPIRRKAATSDSARQLHEPPAAMLQQQSATRAVVHDKEGSVPVLQAEQIPNKQRFSDKAAAFADSFSNMVLNRWQRHPLNLTMQIGKPLLEQQIRRRPLLSLVMAALLGAAAVWFKPWYWRRSHQLIRNSINKEAQWGASSLIYSGSAAIKKLLAKLYGGC